MGNIKDLKFDDKNFNQHTEFGMSQLERSLRNYGAGRSILVDKDNNIIAGNGIAEAAGQMGITKTRVIETTGDELVVVKRTDIELDSKEGREMALADNATSAADLKWDEENIKSESEKWGIDTSSWGIDFEFNSSDGEVQEVEAPEVNESEPADSQLGGVYQLGEHRLMCGDSTDMASMAILMDNKQADLLITDPPYNVAYGQYGSATEARALHRRVDSKQILNDKMESDEFRTFLVKAYSAADSVMRSGAVFYIFHADNESYNFRGACLDMGWTIRECLIWNKDRLCLGRQDYQWKHEPCLYGWKEGSHEWYNDRKQTTVLDFDRPTKSDEHPTMKPVGLFSYLIQNSSKKGDAVLDSFGGSGTTLMACEQLGRKAYVMELDPHYCDVIRKRWWKFKTGSEEGWQEGTRKVEG